MQNSQARTLLLHCILLHHRVVCFRPKAQPWLPGSVGVGSTALTVIMRVTSSWTLTLNSSSPSCPSCALPQSAASQINDLCLWGSLPVKSKPLQILSGIWRSKTTWAVFLTQLCSLCLPALPKQMQKSLFQSTGRKQVSASAAKFVATSCFIRHVAAVAI